MAQTRNVAYVLAAQVARTVQYLISSVVLARILRPADFGLFALAQTVVGLADLVRGSGLSMAVLRRPDATHGQRSNIFWANTGMGLAFMAAGMLTAAPLAAVLHHPGLAVVLLVASPVYLVNGMTEQSRVELMRADRFDRLALIEAVVQVSSLAVGIVAALVLRSAVALALQLVVSYAVGAVLTIAVARWRPDRPTRGLGTMEFVRFGVATLGTDVVSFVSQNIDNFLVGWRLGTVPLGFYSKAYQTAQQPLVFAVEPFGAMTVQQLSRAHSDEGDPAGVLGRQVTVATFGVLPVLVMGAAASSGVIAILFGPQWHTAAPLLTILCVGTMFRVPTRFLGWSLVAAGRAGLRLRVAALAQVVTIGALVAVLSRGVVAVAVVIAAGLVLELVVTAVALARVGLPVRRVLGPTPGRIVGAALLAGVLAWAVRPLAGESVLQVVVVVVVTLAATVAAMVASGDGRAVLRGGLGRFRTWHAR